MISFNKLGKTVEVQEREARLAKIRKLTSLYGPNWTSFKESLKEEPLFGTKVFIDANYELLETIWIGDQYQLDALKCNDIYPSKEDILHNRRIWDYLFNKE